MDLETACRVLLGFAFLILGAFAVAATFFGRSR